MVLTIISATPRIQANSNTDKIIASFKSGVETGDWNCVTYYLSRRNTWQDIKRAISESDNILFALPLYVECIPGIMAEFLEEITPREYGSLQTKAKMSFILHSGFSEASQLRCGEEYLKQLAGYLNFEYAGTLIKGGTFAFSLVGEKMGKKMALPFYEMGVKFSKNGCFDQEVTKKFAGPEYMPKGQQFSMKVFKPVQRMIFNALAKKQGCKEKLDVMPYKDYVR